MQFAFKTAPYITYLYIVSLQLKKVEKCLQNSSNGCKTPVMKYDAQITKEWLWKNFESVKPTITAACCCCWTPCCWQNSMEWIFRFVVHGITPMKIFCLYFLDPPFIIFRLTADVWKHVNVQTQPQHILKKHRHIVVRKNEISEVLPWNCRCNRSNNARWDHRNWREHPRRHGSTRYERWKKGWHCTRRQRWKARHHWGHSWNQADFQRQEI